MEPIFDILNILQDELINPIDEHVANILNQGINDGDDREDELDEYLLGLLEADDENGLEIYPRRGAPVRIRIFFEETIPQYNDDQFYSHFRMRREVFIELENGLRPHVPNGGIPLRKKILLTIWISATPESFRSVADRFDLCKTAAHFAFKEIIQALSGVLLSQYIAGNRLTIETAFRSGSNIFRE